MISRVVLCLWILPAVVFGQPVLDEVVYATVGGEPLHLDVRLPTDESPGPWPLVLYVHGGGWSMGSHNGIPPFISALPGRGFAVASAQYRLTSQGGQWGSESVAFPAQIHDLKGAVRFLRANAETYNLDPERFAAWGPSAGGHLASLLGTSGDETELEGTIGGNLAFSSRVQAVVNYFGPVDILMMNLDFTDPPGSIKDHDAPTSSESALIGFNGPGEGIGVLRANQDNPDSPYPELMLLARQTNPITWIDGDDPPFFIVHGEEDMLVPIRQSERLAQALADADVELTFTRVPAMGHETPPVVHSLSAAAFLEEVLAPETKALSTAWSLY